MKDDERHGLLKIPDEVIIKELRVELGKANSYIHELEDENMKLKIIPPEEKKKIRKGKIFDEYKKEIIKLNKIISNLRKDNENLIIKLTKQ